MISSVSESRNLAALGDSPLPNLLSGELRLPGASQPEESHA